MIDIYQKLNINVLIRVYLDRIFKKSFFCYIIYKTISAKIVFLYVMIGTKILILPYLNYKDNEPQKYNIRQFINLVI
jgi:hypothetical protein